MSTYIAEFAEPKLNHFCLYKWINIKIPDKLPGTHTISSTAKSSNYDLSLDKLEQQSPPGCFYEAVRKSCVHASTASTLLERGALMLQLYWTESALFQSLRTDKQTKHTLKYTSQLSQFSSYTTNFKQSVTLKKKSNFNSWANSFSSLCKGKNCVITPLTPEEIHRSNHSIFLC